MIQEVSFTLFGTLINMSIVQASLTTVIHDSNVFILQAIDLFLLDYSSKIDHTFKLIVRLVVSYQTTYL